MSLCESRTHDHERYQEALQKAQEWLRLSADHLTASSDATGDKYALAGKRERVQVRMWASVSRFRWECRQAQAGSGENSICMWVLVRVPPSASWTGGGAFFKNPVFLVGFANFDKLESTKIYNVINFVIICCWV